MIFIIDDNETRAHGLSSALTFVGEPNQIINKDDLPKALQEYPESTIILGALNTQTHRDLISQHPELPFLLVGNTLKPLIEIANVIGLIEEPFVHDVTTQHIHDCQQYLRLKPTTKEQRKVVSFNGLVGDTESVNHVRFLISQVAKTQANVLILGESGTGKEVVARNVHLLSQRKDGPFVPVNCGAIPGELLESELFGHEKGAFTGAIAARKGRFELAQGGTLFLDEIGDMPLQMQVKLLRVLQERTYERVGGSKPIKADVRIIAATHRNLETMIQDGDFREDLYYRLNVFPIDNPSLKERTDDIGLLLKELVKRITSQTGQGVKFTDRAIESLKCHSWPGNIRELGNLVERMVIMYPDQVVDVPDLPQKYQHLDVDAYVPEYPDELLELQALNDIFGEGFVEDSSSESDSEDVGIDMNVLPAEGIKLKEYLAELEVNLISQALERFDYVVAHAAEVLGVRRTTLVEKMKKYNLNRD